MSVNPLVTAKSPSKPRTHNPDHSSADHSGEAASADPLAGSFWYAEDPGPSLALVARIRKRLQLPEDVAEAVRTQLAPETDRMNFHEAAFFLACEYDDWDEHHSAVEVHCQRLERYPLEVRTFLELAMTLREIAELELALKCVDLILRWEPTCKESTEYGIYLLRQMGRNWRTHDWPVELCVAELDATLRERCYRFIQKERAASWCEFFTELLREQVLAFDEQEFVRFLEQDARLENIGDKYCDVFALREVSRKELE